MKSMFKMYVWMLFAWCFPNHEVERLVNKPGNEMWRAGGGYHAYRKYFRIDWGTRGWRFVRKIDYYKDHVNRQIIMMNTANQYESWHYTEQLSSCVLDVPTDVIHYTNVVRNGMVITERDDLWQKVWSHAEKLLREQ